MLPSSRSALASLDRFQKTRKSPTDIINEAMAQYGVPEIRGRVSDLRKTLTNTEQSLRGVEKSVTGRTQGSLVTEAQRSAIANKEREPIMEDYSSISGNLNTEIGDLESALGVAQALSSANVARQEGDYQGLLDRYNITSSAESEMQRRKEAAQAAAESRRQFDLQLQESRASRAGSGGGLGGGLDLSKYLGGGGQALPAGMTEKIDKLGNFKGFAFTAGNKPVSALNFASKNKMDFGDLLYSMGQSGDSTAQRMYNWLKSIGGSDMFKSGKYKNTPAWKQTFSSLTWGS